MSLAGLFTHVYPNSVYTRFQLCNIHYMDGLYKRETDKWEPPKVRSNQRYNMYITCYTFQYVNDNANLFEKLNISYKNNMKMLEIYDTPNIDEAEENGLLYLYEMNYKYFYVFLRIFVN